VVPDTTYRCEHHRLEPGARLLLYTDGVVEARDPRGAAFGDAALARAVGREASPDASLAAALACLRAHRSAEEIGDDATVLIVDHLSDSGAS
jgi:phosphoserine phosphatase RsbU/P